jgi:hypothetical protein
MVNCPEHRFTVLVSTCYPGLVSAYAGIPVPWCLHS